MIQLAIQKSPYQLLRNRHLEPYGAERDWELIQDLGYLTNVYYKNKRSPHQNNENNGDWREYLKYDGLRNYSSVKSLSLFELKEPQ